MSDQPPNLSVSRASCKGNAALRLLSRLIFLCFATILWMRGVPAALAAEQAIRAPAAANVVATPAAVHVMAPQTRDAVIKALRAIQRGEWTKAKAGIAATGDPLAQKIYDWMLYTRNPGDKSFEAVTAFALANPDWPGQSRMQLHVEKMVTDKTPDAAVIAWFDKNKPLTQNGIERYLKALGARNAKTKMAENASGWWREADMTPAQQNDFYNKFSSSIDEKSHRIRFDRMIFSEQYTNARAIARILGRGYPALAEARIAIATDKGGVDAIIARVPPHLAADPGLAYERLRWRRRHNKDMDALEILHNPPPADLITNPGDWWKERHIMARRMIEQKQYESAYLLVSKHRLKEGVDFASAEFLAGFLALRFLKQPWRAFEHFEALYHRVETPISKSRGAYWAGRASVDLGHPEIARQWFTVAARHQTTYYGQLALAELDDAFKPPQQLPPERTLEARNAFNRMEMVQVIRLLHKAGLRKETGSFLDALAEKLDNPQEYILVADLAEELEHFHNAVRIAKKGFQKNIFLLEHAFPTILSRLKNIDLEWALVHAIIRQESAFDTEAQSHAGAGGLMQLMPATAAEVARKNGWPHQQEWLTARPDHNIRLGSAYMKQMIARFDGSYLLAAAAYNAGPGRVDKWLKEIGDPRTGAIDLIDWAELIPIYETRNYVQRVLEAVYVYRVKLGDVQKSANAPIHVANRKAK